ncbi:DUF4145 domain-containing protein [Rhizobium sp. L245/93]|uniref:DUF4145 domain-containing protein n=1 Tax=Rhizobium sp. L245/93 TaxID=2819998 RepID=UPI001ADBAD08|nr:DUF4145 domain-containing protein [Rhizobium sp. L245/93]MBO9172460.1 DUF4145 domain-containing protein [Rhizobium sp. L245/93]
MDKRIWRRAYSAFVRLPCPHCATGLLKLDNGTLLRHEPAYSKQERSEAGGALQLLTERFSCHLICDKSFCREAVVVSGFVSIDEQFSNDEDGEVSSYETTFFWPKAMFPAPPVIAVSKKLSQDCKIDLHAAFALLWTDYAACANRLRIFVEHMLDQLDVSRRSEDGKERELYLSQRIALFGQTHPHHALSLNALREVGNRGSHAGKAEFSDLVDCFYLLQHPISDLIDKPHELDAGIAQRLIEKNQRQRPKKVDQDQH